MRGMRHRLCHRPRRGVLRAAEGQRPNRRRLCIPALDRHHLCADGKGAGRQDPAHHHGLRPLGVARRVGIPVELPAARHLLDGGRHSPAAHRQEGRRLRQAKGKKIALVYHDSPYGKEPIALLQKRAQMHGFETLFLPVTHPGVEQKATWLQIRQNRPDYVLLWGWGVMNSTAIKEAVAVGYPREKMYGVWWSGAEPDVRPAEAGAKGYNAATLQH